MSSMTYRSPRRRPAERYIILLGAMQYIILSAEMTLVIQIMKANISPGRKFCTKI